MYFDEMERAVVYLILLLTTTTAIKNTYKGWKLYRFWPPTENMVETFGLLHESTEYFDYWTAIREPNDTVDIAVERLAHPTFDNLLFMLNTTGEVQIEHIDKTLNREGKEMKEAPNPEPGQINFLKYHRYDTIMNYMNNLAEKYGDIVSVETIGQSVEGRDIKVVKISTPTLMLKPAILIDAALSPREWIGPAQALYIIQELVENADNRAMLENVDWYIIPLVNPDGYEYTHTVQRLWKKNRSKNSKQYGTYLNRNFDINFGKNLSSPSGDAWNYHGEKPFSEPETDTLKKFIENRSERIKLYLSLHSFGPTILYPYGYTEEPPKNIEAIKRVAEKVSEKLEEAGSAYVAKRASSKKYIFSGNSIDWAVEKMTIPYAYTIELPSPGYLGFDFPVHRIEGVVKEFMVGLKAFHDFVKSDFILEEKQKDEL